MIKSFVIVPLQEYKDLSLNNTQTSANILLSKKSDLCPPEKEAESVEKETETASAEKDISKSIIEKQGEKCKFSHRQMTKKKFLKTLENNCQNIRDKFPNIDELIGQAISLKKKKISNEEGFYKYLYDEGLMSLVKNKHKLNLYCPSWFKI